mmetsp:Transcript_36630/g.114358  ORF Transcript_36630/g.114358 Transcript_36630/m.114358 type:complete len:223 (+) Transcript_36630:1004-1672(+)
MVSRAEAEGAREELVHSSIRLLPLPPLQVSSQVVPTNLQPHRADAGLQLLAPPRHDPLDLLVRPVQECMEDRESEDAEGLGDGVDVVLVEVCCGKPEESLRQDHIIRHAVVPVLAGQQLSVLAILLLRNSRHLDKVSMLGEIGSDAVQKYIDGPVILVESSSSKSRGREQGHDDDDGVVVVMKMMITTKTVMVMMIMMMMTTTTTPQRWDEGLCRSRWRSQG